MQAYWSVYNVTWFKIGPFFVRGKFDSQFIRVGTQHGNNILQCQCKVINWLVGCFGFNGPLRQYFSLYRAVSHREGEGEEKG